MSYTAEISRNHPTAFLFLIDQSGSMVDSVAAGKTKADQVADVLNRTIANIIVRCTKSDGVRDYFDLGVIAYGGEGVGNGFQGDLQNQLIHPISAVEPAFLRIEERQKKIDDGAGGIFEQTIKFPIWFEPEASGGTPMRAALVKAAEVVTEWCALHPESYPPTILHITDGASTDGDPEEFAKLLLQIRTNDGPVLMFNLHLSSSLSGAIKFPSSEFALQDEYSRLLFRMSSVLPEHLVHYAKEKGIAVDMESKGFIFNADFVEIVDFFDIGTRASQLR